jgi:hypothetical protein
MELFIFFFIGLVAFATLSLALGVDSRDAYRTERQLPLTSSWV